MNQVSKEFLQDFDAKKVECEVLQINVKMIVNGRMLKGPLFS